MMMTILQHVRCGILKGQRPVSRRLHPPSAGRPCLFGCMLLCIAMGATACGRGGASLGESGASARLSLVIGARSEFDPDLSANAETGFRITVSGHGIAERVLTYSAETDAALIEDLPNGAVVDIVVEAVNSVGDVVKRGYAENIAIRGGLQEAELDIVRVPVFTNLNPQSTLTATRLRFRILAEPTHTLALSARREDGSVIALRASSGASAFVVPENGELGIDPVNLGMGTYTLTLKDTTNGEKTERLVVVHPGVKSEPYQFTAGNALGSMRYQKDGVSTHLLDVWSRAQ